MANTCSSCGEPHGADDIFCENCGLDFVTGTLPEPEAAVTSIGGADPPVVAGGSDEVLTISCDFAFHQGMDTDDVLEYPSPEPDPVTVSIAGETVLIGRERSSRGIFPDVDLASDPAVSSRHAVLQRGADGTWTVTDLGSTNGTYVGDSTEAITPDVPVHLEPGVPVFVGAWTRLDITQAPAAA